LLPVVVIDGCFQVVQGMGGINDLVAFHLASCLIFFCASVQETALAGFF
jgi:hypothetical protein